MAISVLTIAFLGFGSFFVVNSNTFDRIREEAMVTYAMRQMAEMIRGAPFARIWTAYEDYSFTVPEINASGKVTCFTNEKGTFWKPCCGLDDTLICISARVCTR